MTPVERKFSISISSIFILYIFQNRKNNDNLLIRHFVPKLFSIVFISLRNLLAAGDDSAFTSHM